MPCGHARRQIPPYSTRAPLHCKQVLAVAPGSQMHERQVVLSVQVQATGGLPSLLGCPAPTRPPWQIKGWRQTRPALPSRTPTSPASQALTHLPSLLRKPARHLSHRTPARDQVQMVQLLLWGQWHLARPPYSCPRLHVSGLRTQRRLYALSPTGTMSAAHRSTQVP